MSEKKVPITVQEREILRKKSAQSLPDVPSLQNWTPKQFKNAITKCLFDDENSFYAYINRMAMTFDEDFVTKENENCFRFEENILSFEDFANKVIAKQSLLNPKPNVDNVNKVYFGTIKSGLERTNIIGLYFSDTKGERVSIFSSNGDMKLFEKLNNANLVEKDFNITDFKSSNASIESLSTRAITIDDGGTLNQTISEQAQPNALINKGYVDEQLRTKGGTFVQANVDETPTQELKNLKVKEIVYALNELGLTFSTEKLVDGTPLQSITVGKGTPNEFRWNIKGNGSITVDSGLSTSSVNPVENKVVTKAINSKLDKDLGNKPNGYALLDEFGYVNPKIIPSHIDDIINGTLTSKTKFTDEFGVVWTTGTLDIDNKLFLDTNTHKVYQWSGVEFASLSSGVSKKYVDDQLLTKVDKITEQEKLYATDNQGQQTSIQYNVEPLGNDIVKRTSGGQVKTTTPTQNNDATNKEYVDTQLSAVNLKEKFDTTGSDVVVDVAEDNQHLEVHLDQAYKDSVATKTYVSEFLQKSAMVKYSYENHNIFDLEFFNLITTTPKVQDGALFSLETKDDTTQEALANGFPMLDSGSIIYGYFYNGLNESPMIILCDKGLFKITDGTTKLTCEAIGGGYKAGDGISISTDGTISVNYPNGDEITYGN